MTRAGRGEIAKQEGAPTAELGYNPNSPYNPIDDALQCTRQHYYDFLKREPDFSGRNRRTVMREPRLL